MQENGYGSVVERVADALVALHGQGFGGKADGRFRISRKFLRQLSGRRSLPNWLVVGLMEALFERGFVFIPAETFFVVMEQRIFNSYRRVTATAANQACWTATARSSDGAGPDATEPVIPR